MNPEQLSKFDMGAAFICDSLPPMWKRMYDRLLEVGFSESDAMLVLRTYIAAYQGKVSLT